MRAIDADAISYESIDTSDTGRHEHYYGTGIIAVRKEDIDAMPTIQPEPHWIPVTERLPEYRTEVLTYNRDEEFEINHIIDDEDGEWFLNGAIAWMPLPEPFKEVTT